MFRKLTKEDLSDNPIGYIIVESEQSWINSVLAVGGFFGPFASGFLADWKGRKLALWLAGVIHIVGWIMLLQSTSVGLMIAARFVQGFAGGCILNGLTMYIGEIASDEFRGILGSFLQIGQTSECDLGKLRGNLLHFYYSSWYPVRVSNRSLRQLHLLPVDLLRSSTPFYNSVLLHAGNATLLRIKRPLPAGCKRTYVSKGRILRGNPSRSSTYQGLRPARRIGAKVERISQSFYEPSQPAGTDDQLLFDIASAMVWHQLYPIQ